MQKSFPPVKTIKNRVDLEFWRNPEFEVYFFTISMELKKPYFDVV